MRDTESGMTLVTVALALVVVLGMAALAIDLTSFYLARSEAQRAADGAALAGAQVFVSSGFTSGLITQAVVQPLATQQAIAVGNQNLVGGTIAGPRGSGRELQFLQFEQSPHHRDRATDHGAWESDARVLRQNIWRAKGRRIGFGHGGSLQSNQFPVLLEMLQTVADHQLRSISLHPQ